MKHWMIVLAAIALLFLHERLCATKFWFLGGTLPLAGMGALGYQLAIAKIHFSAQLTIAYAVFFAVTIVLWIVGRHAYRQKELNRMRAKDMN